MNCIICQKEADEVGSHIIPASLIKNCVGAHYKEESFTIDSQNAIIDVYYGRDNLKNTSTEIKPNDYKRDYILCKVCEKKLAGLESKFSAEFLAKFRHQKFEGNFKITTSPNGYEIFEPKRLNNSEIQAYFYSIILRYCTVYEMEGEFHYLQGNEILNIETFVRGFLYGEDNYQDAILSFSIAVIFNKYSDHSLFIATSNQIQKPYIFCLCDAIVLLFTTVLSPAETVLFEEYINSITQASSKMVVGPERVYLELSENMSRLMAGDFITNGIFEISQLNHRTYTENLMEVQALLDQYTQQGHPGPIGQVFEDLRQKYTT